MRQDKDFANQARDIMAEQNFMHRFDVALHWYLPKAEANDIWEDYQDIRRQASRDGSQMFQAEEDPRKMPRELLNPREYRRWLGIFCALLVCPLIPFLFMMCEWLPFLDWWPIPTRLSGFLFWLGLALALILTHRWKKVPGEPVRSYKLMGEAFAFLLFDVAGALGVIYFFWHIFTGNDPRISGNFVIDCLGALAFINGVICLAALVMCRVRSCRWLGVYVIGLTMLLGIVYYMELFVSMDLSEYSLLYGWEQLTAYFLPLACGLAVSLKSLW